MAAPLLSRLVIILTPEGPHFRARMEMMVKEWHRWAHVINIPPVYHRPGDPCDPFTHRSIAGEDSSLVLRQFPSEPDTKQSSLSQKRAHSSPETRNPRLRKQACRDKRGKWGKGLRVCRNQESGKPGRKTCHPSVLAAYFYHLEVKMFLNANH